MVDNWEDIEDENIELPQFKEVKVSFLKKLIFNPLFTKDKEKTSNSRENNFR